MFENRQKDRTTDHAQKKKWRELARIVGPALEPAPSCGWSPPWTLMASHTQT